MLLLCRGWQKKCTEVYNGSEESVFCEIKLLFSDVLVAVAAVVVVVVVAA